MLEGIKERAQHWVETKRCNVEREPGKEFTIEEPIGVYL